MNIATGEPLPGDDSQAWKNGSWLPLEQTALSLDDIGFLQGVVIVDRLRTVDLRALDVGPHVERWRSGCAAVGITLPAEPRIEELIQQVIQRNAACFPQQDFSVVMLATPGRAGEAGRPPTLILHALPIPWTTLSRWYELGQPLRAASQHSVPGACWSPAIKTRSRLQYYLADREAKQQARDSSASGVLLSSAMDGTVSLTETSAANILIVERVGQSIRRLISPPRERILNGISLRRTLRIAEQAGIETRFEPISVERAEQAEEIILCGTTGCVWSASQFNDRRFSAPARQPTFQILLEGWLRELGVDFIAQAHHSARKS